MLEEYVIEIICRRKKARLTSEHLWLDKIATFLTNLFEFLFIFCNRRPPFSWHYYYILHCAELP